MSNAGTSVNEGTPIESDELTEAQLTDLFHHDPLDADSNDGGNEEPVAPAAPQGGAPAAPVAAAPAAPVAPAGTAPAAPAPNGQAAPASPQAPQLTAEAIAAAVREAVAPPQRDNPQDTVPQYMFQVPDQLMGAIESEDPAVRKQGMAVLISGALRAVHTQIRQEMAQALSSFRTEVPQAIHAASAAQTQQRQVFEDFYSTNPDLKVPELGPFVYGQAQALARERPDLIQGGWNERFRDELALRVRSVLKWAPPAPANGGTPPRRQTPPRMLNGGARPAGENLTGQDAALADIFG